MKRIAALLLVMFVPCFHAFGQPVMPEKGGDVLATVGSHEITRAMLDNIIATIPEENRVPFLTPDGRKKILDEVVSFLLFSEAAKTEGIDKDPAIKTRLDYTQTEYLAREYFRRFLAKSPQVSEDDLQAFYKSHINEFKPPEEIKARHIVVKTEAQANKVLDELKTGQDFAELAKKYSIDPAAANGGKLVLPDGREWLPKGSFEKSFEFTLFKIPKGEVGGPVKTQFGWHILKVDDRRQPETPSFVQVRSMIRTRLQDEKNVQLHNQLTEELKKKIPVVVK
jgi:peptidyl-prolyl cis-trans isomerase C